MLRGLSRIVLLSAISIQLSGCAAAVLVGAGAAGGAGTAIYVKGKWQEELNAPLSKVHTATLSALKALELPTIEDKKDKMTAKVRSQFADGKRVFIDIRAVTESSTKITIRVGFGDKSKSEKISKTIHRYL